MNKNNYSKAHKRYLAINRFKTITIALFQILILVVLFVGWEVGSRTGAIDVFFFSSPSRIWETLQSLHASGELFTHAWVTLKETLIAFGIATSLGILLAILLWWSEYLRKILEPYIVTLNSLPKIALGPIIIIWMGVGSRAIITMAVLIVVIVTTLNVMNAFLNTDKNLIATLKSFGANKFQIFMKVVFPASVPDIISTLKVNVGLSCAIPQLCHLYNKNKLHYTMSNLSKFNIKSLIKYKDLLGLPNRSFYYFFFLNIPPILPIAPVILPTIPFFITFPVA